MMENDRQVLQKNWISWNILNLFLKFNLSIKVNDVFYGIIKILNEKK